MPRYSSYDSDDERLPEGMRRVGYDADTQTYTYRDSDGSLWEGPPGARYGHLTQVASAPKLPSHNDDDYDHDDDDDENHPPPPYDEEAPDSQPFLNPYTHTTARAQHQHQQPSRSWRQELMPLLNFFLILGLFLLGVFWYMHIMAGKTPEAPPCEDPSVPYVIGRGDTCWAIAKDHGLSVDDLLRGNKGISCDNLQTGTVICLPGV